MKKSFFTIALIAMVLCPLAVQGAYMSNRYVKDFNQIDLGISGDVYITIGSTFEVILEGDEYLLDEIVTEVRNGKLSIEYKKPIKKWNSSKKITVNITMPNVEGLSVSGSGTITMKEPLMSDSFVANISGSGNIYLNDVHMKQGKCNISGSGDVYLNGNGEINDLEISIAGSGNFEAKDIITDDLIASVTGSGDCKCNVSDNLTANIVGSGRIYFYGEPRVKANILGSGRVISI